MAEILLKEQGWKIVALNYHCKVGEIDLVAWDKETLVFVEVKHYKSRSMKPAHQSITKSKIVKIRKTAAYYVMKEHPGDVPIRFDAMIFEDYQLLDHFKGAF